MIAPNPATGISGTYQGDPGTNNRYYWVQAIYPSSRAALSSPVLVPNVASLNPYNNKVSISWRQSPGAIGYDVIVTSNNTVPTVNDTLNAGLIFGTTATTFTDQGQVHQAWTYETGTGSGGGGTPSDPVDSIQFNNLGAFGGDSNLLWDNTNKLAKIGGEPITPFAGLYVGPDESTLPAYIQGWTTGRVAAISDGSGGELNALNVLWSGGGNGAISVVSYGANLGNDGALNIDAIGTIDGGNTAVIDAAAGADGAITLASASVLSILDAFLSGGAAITDNYAIKIADITRGTNNWAIKTGLGLVAVGGNPLTMFDGLYVGSDESTLPALLQGYVGTAAALITKSTNDTNIALGIEAVGDIGIYVALVGGTNGGERLSGSAADVYAGADLQTVAGHVSFLSANGFAVTNLEGFYVYSPSLGGGSATNSYAFYAADQTGATNPYYSWFDSRGVRRVKEDNTFDSVGQAIEALYNPQFTKYTPGAADYERIILGQWSANIGEIGIEKGGTGTLRNLRLVGNGLIGRLSIAAVADGDLSAGDFSIWFDDQNTTPAINFKAKKANGSVVTATVLLT